MSDARFLSMTNARDILPASMHVKGGKKAVE
jgi:hypothetical protein